MGNPALSYQIGWRSDSARVVFNEHRDAAGVQDPTKTKDTYLVERFDFSPLEFRDQRDGLHLALGGDLGVVSDEFRFVSLAGEIVGTTPDKVEDRVAKLFSAFDPVNCVAASPSTRGVHLLDFWMPTDEAGYADPIRECFFARPTGIPAVYERRASGLAVLFALQLVCPSTRRYLYTAESKVANAGNGWSIALPNWTAAQGAPTTGVITLALTAAGDAACTLRYVDTLTSVTTNLVLDLSGIGGGAHTVTIDVGTGIIKLDGAVRADLRTSAVNTAVWQINAGGGTFSVPSGRTNLTSATMAYRQARA